MKILTKCDCTNFLLNWTALSGTERKSVAIGFTLTGYDELERGASTNTERIEAMKKLHEAGFKTFASIEPVIDPDSSLRMIRDARRCCDLFKVGLKSGAKYDPYVLRCFTRTARGLLLGDSKIYFKDSLLARAGIDRADLPANCVGRDYDLFTPVDPKFD